MIDVVNDYVNGIKTEKDIIAGLKQVYENDKKEYVNALTAKKLTVKNYRNGLFQALKPIPRIEQTLCL